MTVPDASPSELEKSVLEIILESTSELAMRAVQTQDPLLRERTMTCYALLFDRVAADVKEGSLSERDAEKFKGTIQKDAQKYGSVFAFFQKADDLSLSKEKQAGSASLPSVVPERSRHEQDHSEVLYTSALLLQRGMLEHDISALLAHPQTELRGTLYPFEHLFFIPDSVLEPYLVRAEMKGGNGSREDAIMDEDTINALHVADTALGNIAHLRRVSQSSLAPADIPTEEFPAEAAVFVDVSSVSETRELREDSSLQSPPRSDALEAKVAVAGEGSLRRLVEFFEQGKNQSIVEPDLSIALSNTRLYYAQCMEQRLRNEGLFDAQKKQVRIPHGDTVFVKDALEMVSGRLVGSLFDFGPTAVSQCIKAGNYLRTTSGVKVKAYEALFFYLTQKDRDIKRYSVSDLAKRFGADAGIIGKIFERGDFTVKVPFAKSVVLQKKALANALFDAVDALLQGRSLLPLGTAVSSEEITRQENRRSVADEEEIPSLEKAAQTAIVIEGVDSSLAFTNTPLYLAQCFEARVRREGLYDFDTKKVVFKKGDERYVRKSAAPLDDALRSEFLGMNARQFYDSITKRDYLQPFTRHPAFFGIDQAFVVYLIPGSSRVMDYSAQDLAELFGAPVKTMQELKNRKYFVDPAKKRYKPALPQRSAFAHAVFLVLDTLNKGETLLQPTVSYTSLKESSPAETYA